MNGGYLMVSKADTKIYDKLQLGLKVGKPILWYESDTVCYYIDTISGGEITSEIVDDEEVITYGDIILTKGGKTITVSYDGTDATVTEEGDIANPLMENIVDSQGNKRFIEGDGEITIPTGVTITYNKWSLSGTHLMFVLAGSVADTTMLSDLLSFYNIPKWVWDKIYPVWSDNIEIKATNLVNDDYSTQPINFRIAKSSVEGRMYIRQSESAITLTKDRAFRIQFDLLIDTDYSE